MNARFMINRSNVERKRNQPIICQPLDLIP